MRNRTASRIRSTGSATGRPTGTIRPNPAVFKDAGPAGWLLATTVAVVIFAFALSTTLPAVPQR